MWKYLSRFFAGSRTIAVDPRYGVAYGDIALSVAWSTDGGEWKVVIEAGIIAESWADRSALLLHLDSHPSGSASLIDAANAVTEYSEDQAGATYVRLSWPEATPGGWNGTRIRFQFTWRAELFEPANTRDKNPSSTQSPCFVLPEMLPRLSSDAAPIPTAPPSLPIIRYDRELPPELDAGGIALPDDNGEPLSDLLQTVIFVRPSCHADAAHVGVAEGRDGQLNSDSMSVVVNRTRTMLEFIANEYGFRPPVRPVICISDVEFPLINVASGAFAPMKPEWIGVSDPALGKDLSAIRLLAQGWLGGGVKLWGENSVSLTLGVAGALGLRWYQVNDRFLHLEQTLAWQESDVAQAVVANSWSEYEEALAIQLPLFRAMEDGKVQKELGALLREHWGFYLQQSVLIDLLRRFDVALPRVFY